MGSEIDFNAIAKTAANKNKIPNTSGAANLANMITDIAANVAATAIEDYHERLIQELEQAILQETDTTDQ